LGALGRMIPIDRRIVVIEDTRELRMRGLRNGDNCVYLLTRPATIEGLPAITQKDLVIAALRQRPDALTVGEARGAEVFDMLKALWTGHKNGLTSVHADTIADVSSRIRMMLQETSFSTEVSEGTVAMWIARAFQLGVTLRRTDSGRRYVEEIVEFTGGVEGNVPVTTPLFRYDQARRRMICTGQRLDRRHEGMLREAGFSYDLIVQAGRERGEVG
jgi:pilus assembly protein CpaF